MKEIWFISDTHFGHKNILEYEKEARPFSSLEEMHEVIIERWNSVVKQDDVVYHLGDFAFGKGYIDIAQRLNGKKRLIMGNHDTYSTSHYLRYFDKCYGVKYWERCVLSHMPVHPNGLGARWLLNVHGHLHSRKVMIQPPPCRVFVDDPSYFNVSCEQNNLTPINADVIRERVKQL